MSKYNGYKAILLAGLLVIVLGSCAPTIAGQDSGGMGQPSQPQPPPDRTKSQSPALILSDAPAAAAPVVAAPVDPAEQAAMKQFSDAPMTDLPTKIRLGEAFVLKYPHSQDDVERAYSSLAYCYLFTGEAKKVREAGEKAIAINDKDANALAVMALTIPRALDSSDKNPGATLATAQDYAQRAIQVTSMVTKPANVSDADFASTQNELLSMAHDGMGVAYFRLQKYSEAVPELESAVKLASKPDPVTLYILGSTDSQLSHYDDAVSAFGKCAATPGALMDICKSKMEEAKKSAATRPSAPK